MLGYLSPIPVLEPYVKLATAHLHIHTITERWKLSTVHRSTLSVDPMVFALDQTNYARWLSSHIRDLSTLAQVHPNVDLHFRDGNFVIHKTARMSSAMSIDQGHEQNNALVKATSCAIGLTDNTSAFRRWMVSGPEVGRILTDFETEFCCHHNTGIKHHEPIPSVQTTFHKQVNSLVTIFEEKGNHFIEESLTDLLVR